MKKLNKHGLNFNYKNLCIARKEITEGLGWNGRIAVLTYHPDSGNVYVSCISQETYEFNKEWYDKFCHVIVEKQTTLQGVIDAVAASYQKIA